MCIRDRDTSDQKAGANLWITEIYQNDTNRSAVYGNSSDQMEFVEVTNTTDKAIDFNSQYGLWYEYLSGDKYVMKQLTVRTVDGSDQVTIGAGQTAILWSQRKDLDVYATEEEFREAMRVPDSVPVFTVSGQNGFAENDRGFAIKTSQGDTVSYYHYNTTTDEVTADGLAVHLKIPDSVSYTHLDVYKRQDLVLFNLNYSEGMFTAINDVQIITNGTDKYEKLFYDLEHAKNSIHIVLSLIHILCSFFTDKV